MEENCVFKIQLSAVRFIKVGKFSIPADLHMVALNRGVAVYLKTQVEKVPLPVIRASGNHTFKEGSSVWKPLLSLPHQ